ncbi:galactose-binding like [Fusarium sp. NRRL 52700]|nr:galactose-binding like [Fusarium sp. NRRL 52700]
MHFQWTIIAAAFCKAVVAIPCSEIGWSTGSDGENGLDPFDPQGRWEVVKAKDCWVRFQSYKQGQNPNDVRVTKTEFKATPEQVRGTMNNYNNEGGTNIQLWLPLNSRTFQYVPQVLPSGARKLEQVRPASSDQDESSENLRRAEDVGITGLKGTISPEDWAYTSILEARLVMNTMAWEQKNAYLEHREPNLKGPWLTAEKLDKNECVVLDFRDFVNFFIRPRPAGAS